MSPRTGRPTDNPKDIQTKIRMSEEDSEKLDYCCKILGLTRAEVIRLGIDRMYHEAINKPKAYKKNNAYYRRKKSMSRDEQFAEWLKPIAEDFEETKREEWFESVDEEFEEYINKSRAEAIQKNGGSWSESDEDRFQSWVEDEKTRDNEREEDRFQYWFEDAYSKWEEKMREKWDDANPEDE